MVTLVAALENNLNLSIRQTTKYLNNESLRIKQRYGAHIQFDKSRRGDYGKITTGPTGALDIQVGAYMQNHGRFPIRTVDDIDFLYTICALYHESQHLYQQSVMCQEANASEKAISIAIKDLAGFRNKNYYTNTSSYRHDIAEIDAELVGITKTYNFLKNNFPDKDADAIICKLVNDKEKVEGYFIHGQFNSYAEIKEAFSDQYEAAKCFQSNYKIRSFGANNDECAKYLRTFLRHPDAQALINEFDTTTDQFEKDKMMAALVLHLHPEIDYERRYRCLQFSDLSLENVFMTSTDILKNHSYCVEPIDRIRLQDSINTVHDLHTTYETTRLRQKHMKTYEHSISSVNTYVLNDDFTDEGVDFLK